MPQLTLVDCGKYSSEFFGHGVDWLQTINPF